MKPTVRHLMILTTLLLGTVASDAQAAEESFVIADASGPAARFISLNGARNGMPSRTDNGLRPAPALRSDRSAMNNGFMRIDRAMMRPVPSFKAQSASGRTAESGVTVQRGGQSHTQQQVQPTASGDEVADLFSGAPDAAPGSFRDVLSGRTASASRTRFAWPLPATTEQHLSSGYGMRADPFHGDQRFHGGIDLSCATGTPVLAAAEGTVKTVADQGRYGKYVTVQHRDGTESLYGHLNAQNVREGQHVMQGQKLGEVGSTGRATGPHLDFRIKQNGQLVNPMAFLRAPAATGISVASR